MAKIDNSFVENLAFAKGNRAAAFNPTGAFPLDARSYFNSIESAQAAAAGAFPIGDKAASSTYYYGQEIVVVEGDVAKVYVIQPPKGTKTTGWLEEVGAKLEIDSKSLSFDKDGYLEIKDYGDAYYRYNILENTDQIASAALEGYYRIKKGTQTSYEVCEVDGVSDPTDPRPLITYAWKDYAGTPEKYLKVNGFKAGLEPKVVSENSKLVIAWFEPNPTTVEGLASEIASLSTTVNNNAQSVTDLSGKVTVIENEFKANGKVTVLEGKVADLEDAFEAHEELYVGLNEAVGELQDGLETANETIDGVGDRVTVVEGKVQTLEGWKTGLTEKSQNDGDVVNVKVTSYAGEVTKVEVDETELNKKFTAIDKSIEDETAARGTAITTAKSDIIGKDTDSKDANTIYGVKKYAADQAQAAQTAAAGYTDSTAQSLREAAQTETARVNAAIAKAQEDATTAADEKLKSYYNKTEIDGKVNTLTQAIEKEAEDARAAEEGLGNRITPIETWKTGLATEETKTGNGSYVNVTVNTKDGKVSGVSVNDSVLASTLSTTYATKEYVNGKETSLNERIDGIADELGNLASKDIAELGDLSEGVQTSLGLADSAVQPADLNNYYTIGQIDEITNNYDGQIQDLDDKFDGYYTSAQIDGIVDGLTGGTTGGLMLKSVYAPDGTKDGYVAKAILADTATNAEKLGGQDLDGVIGLAKDASAEQLIGKSTDEKGADTIYGAKRYADDVAGTAISDAKDYVDGEIQKLDSSANATGAKGISISVTQVDGKLTAATVDDAVLADYILKPTGADITDKIVVFDSENGVKSSGTSISDINDAIDGAKEYAEGQVSEAETRTKKYIDDAIAALPKEMVVTSGSVKTVTEADKPYTGAKVGDLYIELIIANGDAVYVPANSLVDQYEGSTSTATAHGVDVAVSSNNVISAELNQKAKTSLGKADSAIQTVKVNGAAVTKDSNNAVDIDLSAYATNNTVKGYVKTVEKGASEGTIKVTDGNGTASADKVIVEAQTITNANNSVQDIATGTANGTIGIKKAGQTTYTNVSVYGLDTMAYENAGDYYTKDDVDGIVEGLTGGTTGGLMLKSEYVGSDAKGSVANADKLEGSTKSQVISSAREGLMVASEYTGTSATKAVANTEKLEGKTKAEVVSEARTNIIGLANTWADSQTFQKVINAQAGIQVAAGGVVYGNGIITLPGAKTVNLPSKAGTIALISDINDKVAGYKPLQTEKDLSAKSGYYVSGITQDAQGVVAIKEAKLPDLTDADVSDTSSSGITVEINELAGVITSVTVTDDLASKYKALQDVVSDPSASGNALAFIDSISQDAQGKITATKKNVNLSAYSTTEQMNAAIANVTGGSTETISNLVSAVNAIYNSDEEKNSKIEEIEETISALTWGSF